MVVQSFLLLMVVCYDLSAFNAEVKGTVPLLSFFLFSFCLLVVVAFFLSFFFLSSSSCCFFSFFFLSSCCCCFLFSFCLLFLFF